MYTNVRFLAYIHRDLHTYVYMCLVYRCIYNHHSYTSLAIYSRVILLSQAWTPGKLISAKHSLDQPFKAWNSSAAETESALQLSTYLSQIPSKPHKRRFPMASEVCIVGFLQVRREQQH